jgi:hypothetical protein
VIMMEDNDRVMDSDDSFDDYLKILDEQEKEKRRQEIRGVQDQIRQEAAAASVNYQDWLSHFELIESQFNGVYEFFGRIEDKVTNWERICSDFDIGDRIYVFSTSIQRSDSFDNRRCMTLEVALPKIADFRDRKPAEVSQEELEADEYRIFKVLENWTRDAQESIGWISQLSSADLEFRLTYGDTATPTVKKTVGIGYLYGHDLTDTCKKIFRMMNEDDGLYNHWEDQLKMIIPEGDYKLKRGNRTQPGDDNLIIHAEDSQWRNE